MTYTRLAWVLLALVFVTVSIIEGVSRGWAAGGILIFFALFPDVAFFGAASDTPGVIKPSHVRLYNALHRAWAPFAIFLVGGTLTYLWDLPAVGFPLFWAGMAWIAHIAVDRSVGFGLRAADGTIIPVGSHRSSSQ